jgi:hypothetical protein
MRPNAKTIMKIGDAERIVVMRMILRAVRLMVFSCVALLSANAVALTEKQIQSVTASALELCRGGTLEGEANTYRIEGSAEVRLVIIKALAEAGLEGKVELTGSDWKGIKAVIPKQWNAAEYNKCVIPIINLFIEKLEGDRTAAPLSPSLASWYNCGAGKLAGDAIVDARVKATYPNAIVMEVDYAYNSRHSSEAPITLRVDAIDDRNVGCGSAFFATQGSIGTGYLTVPIKFLGGGSKVTSVIAMLSGIHYPDPKRIRTSTAPYVCRTFPVAWTH